MVQILKDLRDIITKHIEEQERKYGRQLEFKSLDSGGFYSVCDSYSGFPRRNGHIEVWYCSYMQKYTWLGLVANIDLAKSLCQSHYQKLIEDFNKTREEK